MELFKIQLKQIAQKRQSFWPGKLFQGSHSLHGLVHRVFHSLRSSRPARQQTADACCLS